jgi:ABC-type transport system substrate-binding protein
MMYRLLGPGGSQDYWRHPDWDRLGEQARFSLDSKLRHENYLKMQDIMLEHFPWLPIVQPIESYGVARYLNWRPNPNQLFQLRKDVLTVNH